MNQDIAHHAERLAQICEGWLAVEFRVRTELDNSRGEGGSEPSHLIILDHYIETAKGQRYFEETLQTEAGIQSHGLYVSDGDRCHKINYPTDERKGEKPYVEVSDSFKTEARTGQHECPLPLQFFYLGISPLSKSLATASPLGTGQVDGQPCDQFLLQGEKGQVLVYWLDTTTSVPRQVSIYATEDDRRMEKPRLVWTAREVETVQGHPFPVASEIKHYNKEDRKPFATRTIQVEDLKFDAAYPESQFRVEIPADANVYDSFQKKFSQLARSGPPVPMPQAGTVGIDASQGDPPGRWAGPTVLSLGLGILLMAIYLGWRRQRRLA